MKQVAAIAPLLFAVLAAPAFAQITSAPDGTNTIVTPSGNSFNIDGGTRAGSNLFHSFGRFGLDAGQIANFLSNPTIANILGRVTGGEASIINGQLRVTGSNANLFLINPAGIVFGANASLNVPGSFTATTANGIGIGNGWFNAVGANNYAALTGTPDRFAFVGSQPGAIVNAGNLAVGQGQSLTLLGGTVINTGTIAAPGGTVTIAAVPGEKLIRITQDGSLLSLDLPLADRNALNSSPLTPLSLPALLTSSNLGNATGVSVDANGVVRLTSSNTAIPTAAGTVSLTKPLTVSSQTGSALKITGDRIAIFDAPVRATGNGSGGDITFTGSVTADKVDINTTGKIVFNSDLESSSSIAIAGSGVTAKNIRYGGCFNNCISGANNVRIEATAGDVVLGYIGVNYNPAISNNKTTLIAQNGDITISGITSGFEGIDITAGRFFRASDYIYLGTDVSLTPRRLGGNLTIRHGGESLQIDVGETLILQEPSGFSVQAQVPRPLVSVIGSGTFDFVVGPDLVLERDSNNSSIRLRDDVSGIAGIIRILSPGNAAAFTALSNRPFNGNVYKPNSNSNTNNINSTNNVNSGANGGSELGSNSVNSSVPGLRIGQEAQVSVQRQSNDQERNNACNPSTTIASATTPEGRSLNASNNPCASANDDAQILKILGDEPGQQKELK